MGMEQFRAPALPLPGAQYDQKYTNQLLQALRLYFAQLDSEAACKAYSYRASKFILNQTAGISPAIGELAWNSSDQTLNIGMDYGVIQQVGQELYVRVQNNTGVMIPNGTVVGYVGAGAGNSLSVQPFLADGSMNRLYILGVLTHDLPDTGEIGYCTAFGFVRDFDTTGTPVSETWVAGDELYASPTTAGKLTKVKPTAPSVVAPIATVTTVNATTGAVFVRPVIEQQKYYGVFSDSDTKTAAAIYTPYAITFNTTDSANGFSRGSPTSRIVATQSGLYNFQFSAQITSGSASGKAIWIWPRIDGVDVPNSNSKVTINGSNTTLVPAWNWMLSLNAGQYFEIVYAVDDVGVQLLAQAAQTGANGTATFARPAIPSIILTVSQVQQ